jgi:hypothetical protein
VLFASALSVRARSGGLRGRPGRGQGAGAHHLAGQQPQLRRGGADGGADLLRRFDGPESELHGAPGRHGPSKARNPDRMVAVARARGLTADKRTGLTLADVERALAQGAVVILAIQAWARAAASRRRRVETSWEDGHYVVASGWDDRNVYVMDPSVARQLRLHPARRAAAAVARLRDGRRAARGVTTAWASSSAASPPCAASRGAGARRVT